MASFKLPLKRIRAYFGVKGLTSTGLTSKTVQGENNPQMSQVTKLLQEREEKQGET